MFFDIKVDSVGLNALQGEPGRKEADRHRQPHQAGAREDTPGRQDAPEAAVQNYFSQDDLKRLVFKAIYFVILRDDRLQGNAKVETLDKLCNELHKYSPAEMVAYLHQEIARLWRRGFITEESHRLLQPLEAYRTRLDSSAENSEDDTGSTMMELFELLHGKRVDTIAE